MSRNKPKSTPKNKKSNLLIIVLLVIAVLALIAVTYKIYTDDNYIKARHTVNTIVEDYTGINIQKEFFPDQEEQPSVEEPVKQEITQKEETAEKTKTSSKKGKTDVKNLEFPKCPSKALMITKENSKGVLDTPVKEDSHQIISHNGYTLCYREKYEQPEWVAYTLDKNKVVKTVNRNDNFRPDPDVITGSAVLSDYKSSGYDRGHLCPSADLTYSEESMDESFFLSNMSPQAGPFNRGMWKDLEHQLRVETENFDILYIVTGPVLEKADYPTIGKTEVAVPEYYYKAVLAVKNDNYYMIGFILPNIKCPGTIWDYVVSVDEIENRTGIDFFSALEDSMEISLEKSINPEPWYTN